MKVVTVGIDFFRIFRNLYASFIKASMLVSFQSRLVGSFLKGSTVNAYFKKTSFSEGQKSSSPTAPP